MIDLCSFNKSLKTTWIKKYLDTTNHGKWKFLLDLELENYGRDLIFRGNLNVSDTKKEVLKEILEYWAEINLVDQVSSDIAFQEQFLWFNSLIRIDNKPIFFFQEWFSKVKHLQSGNDNSLTLKHFASKHDLKVRPLSFFLVHYQLLNKLAKTLPILLRQETIPLKHSVKKLLREKSRFH